MQYSNFVHLHVHTEYSLLDGAIKIDQLINRASAFKMPALAITDHGNIFGAIEFYSAAKKAGIKPIIGCEMYIAPGSRHEKTKMNLDKNLPEEAAFHLILLAKDLNGFKNLAILLSKAYIEGFYYKPRIDKELLALYSSGLIGMSACLKGEVPYYLQHGNTQMAYEIASSYKDILGEGNFFLEIQNNGIPEQEDANKKLIQLAKELNLPLVATNDCHYLRKEDSKAHDVLLCIQTGKNINDSKRLRFETEDCYFKSPEEMIQAFIEVPEAIKNTLYIADSCNVEFDLGKSLLPSFTPPNGMNPDEFLEKLALEGLRAKFNGAPPSSYTERLNTELRIIKSMAYSSYFLIVWDFISYAKSRNISVGPGRGSAAGSLVAYALGITEIDPIKYGLLFERFLNPERISMPDIDIDFCRDRRQEVINYVSQKYGADHVAQIITFGTMAARAAIRDVGRALNIPYAEVDKIAKLVPANVDIEDAIKTEPQLRELCQNNSEITELLDIAQKLEGLCRHASTHAAGLVIAPKPLTEYSAFYKNPNEDIITTQFDMKSVEKIGLLKFDFLGLKTLTVIEKTVLYIKQRGGEIDLEKIPLDDPETYKLLTSGHTTGIFQLESPGMRDVLVRMQPNRFEDLMALVALYRPGPMAWIDDFIKTKRGEIPITYELPQLKSILEETYGIILYQEQVMLIANKIAGFTMGQADILRWAMGKKILEQMQKQKEIFIQGAINNKIPKKKAVDLFEKMAPFAKYGFNKSHSAAYAYLAYRTAYLKRHFPIEFMTANLSIDMNDTDHLAKLINECRNMHIPILPPDINKSEREFIISENSIRFGLEAVKGVGSSAIESIIIERKRRPFSSFKDFIHRIDNKKVNKKVIEGLIKAGAFDSLYTESPLLERAKAIADLESPSKDSLSLLLFGGAGDAETKVKEWSEKDLLSYEKEALGFYISGHPILKYRTKLSRLNIVAMAEIETLQDRSEIMIAGVIRDVKIKVKDKGIMAYLTIEDETAISEILVFSDLYKKSAELLKSGNLIIICGQLSKGEKITKILAREIKGLIETIETASQEKYEVCISCDDIEAAAEKMRNIKRHLISHPNGQNGTRIYFKLFFKEYCVILSSPLSPDKNFAEEAAKITCRQVKILLQSDNLNLNYS